MDQKSSDSIALKDDSKKNADHFMQHVYFWLLSAVAIVAIVQMGLLLFEFSQCSQIKAVSNNGTVWDVDSLSCPTPGVKRLRENRNIPAIPPK
jgi:hypothetical protein